MSGLWRICACLVIGLQLLALPAAAQKSTRPAVEDSVAVLQEVSIVADYQLERRSPFAFTAVSGESLDKRSFGQEPSFLLSSLPAVTVYSDAGSYSGYAYFRLRGIDQTRINITLDGVPLNEPEDQGAYFSNYPDFLNSISNVQLIRGVGTTQNGVASYGGSLLFQSPNLYDTLRREIGADWGSFNTYRIYGELNTGIKKGKGLYVRASQLHSDGYKHRSAHTGRSVFYSGGLYGKRNSLKLTGFAGQQHNEMAWLGVPMAAIRQDPRTNANAQEDDRFFQTLSQLQHGLALGRHGSLKTSLYYNYLQGYYDFDLNNFLGLPSTEERYKYAFRSHFGGLMSNYSYAVGALELTTGLHANRYNRRHRGSERNTGPLYENTGFKDEASYFAKLSYRLGPFQLLGDLQGRYVRFRYQGSVALPHQEWFFLNPKGGISWLASNKLTVYYSLGATGREPTRNDMFAGQDDLMADEAGNPLLGITEAEQVLDHELGMRIRGRGWHLNANTYLMRFRNEIVLSGQFGPNGLALTNGVDRSYRAGLELEGQWQMSRHFQFGGVASWNRSRIEQENISFSPILTPPLILQGELAYTLAGLSLALEGRYQQASWIDFANEQQVGSYPLLNSRISYTFKACTASLRAYNLLNRQYFNNGYVDYDGTAKYFVQAPVNAMASLQWRF